MTQFSLMDAVDAAPPHPTSRGTWWWHTWTPGDILPSGWRTPAPEAAPPKPRREAVTLPGVECTDADLDIAKAINTWLPPGMQSPIIGVHETRRAKDGTIHACVEAWDGGLCHVSVREGVLTWGHVPGAGEIVPREGTTEWTRLPARESLDAEAWVWGPPAHWTATWKPGDTIPPGMLPPVAGEVLPSWYFCHDGIVDEQIAPAVWLALAERNPEGVTFPFEAVIETHVLPDGASWACLVAIHDGGLSHVVLRDGTLEWSEAPGAGLLVWREDTRTWGRLPAKDRWDEEREEWVPMASSTEAVSEPFEVDVSETEPSASPVVEPPETLTSETSDVEAPEPPVPVTAPLPSGGIPAFLHATHLATDASWKSLAETLDRTTPGDVRNAVARHVAGGSLSAGNAASLLAILDAAEPPAPVEVAPEDDDYDPVDGSRRRALPPPPGFMEELARKQVEARARREEAWRPLQALVDAGLARAGQYARDRGHLLPPASDGLMLWYNPNNGCPIDVSLWITDADVDPDILTRIEGILGVTARGSATSIRLLDVDTP